VVRYAFTLIELIFAIVVISISVMSLPMMSQITFKTIDNSLVQEAIFASVAGLNEATTYRWDEHSMNDEHTATFDPEYARVVNTAVGGCTVPGAPNKRAGHIHRKCLNDINTRPYTGGAPYSDSLHEAAHGIQSIYIVGGSTSTAGYKKLYNSTLSVTTNASLSDTDLNNPNLKEITINILDNDDNSTVTLLRTYSANIGEVAYATRPLP